MKKVNLGKRYGTLETFNNKENLKTTDQESKSIEERLVERTFKRSEENLHEYLSDMIKTTEWLLRDLKGYQETLNEKNNLDKSSKSMSKKEDVVSWAINQAQQINFHFDNGAMVIGKYMEARLRKENAEKDTDVHYGKEVVD